MSDKHKTEHITATKHIQSTVGSFAERMKRKVRDRNKENQQIDREVAMRHHLLLEAMTAVRRALQETLRINLGERFQLDLNIDDYDGWPRVELNLLDKLSPQTAEHALVIRASDRKGQGIINMSLKSGESLAQIRFDASGEQISKLPVTLKKVVREYLDIVASYTLDPPTPEQLVNYEARPLKTEQTDLLDQELGGQDFFTEKYLEENSVVGIDREASPLDDPMRKELSEEEEKDKQRTKAALCQT